jgi:hypothetical protein
VLCDTVTRMKSVYLLNSLRREPHQNIKQEASSSASAYQGVYGLIAQCEKIVSQSREEVPPKWEGFDLSGNYLPKKKKVLAKRAARKARKCQNAIEFADQQVLDFIVPMAIGHFINKDLPEDERESRLIQFEAFRRFLFWIFRARSLGEMLDLCCGLYTTLTGKSAIGSFVYHLLPVIKEYIFGDESTATQQSLEEVFSSSDWFQSVKSVLESTSDVSKNSLALKFKKLCAFAISSTLLISSGLEQTKAFSFAKKFVHVTRWGGELHFVQVLLNFITDLMTRLKRCYEQGSFYPLISPESQNDWVDRAYRVLEDSEKMGAPQVVGLSLPQFMKDLEDVIAEGEQMVKSVRGCVDASRGVKATLARLRILRAHVLTDKFSKEMRCVPCSTLVYGGSGVAKTAFTDMLMHHFGSCHDLPTGKEFIFTRTSTDQYWTNVGAHQWGIVLDDMAVVRPGTAPSDPSSADVIHVINGVPFCPPIADLASKGTPVMFQYVAGTTNTMDLNAFSWFSNPAAVRRRFPYIVEIIPRPEYARDDAADMLDPSKTPDPLPGHYPDLWLIKVHEVTVRNTSPGQPQMVVVNDCKFKFDVLADFLAWHYEMSKKFRDNQMRAMAASNALNETTICRTHHIPAYMCNCVVAVTPTQVSNLGTNHPVTGEFIPLDQVLPDLPPEAEQQSDESEDSDSEHCPVCGDNNEECEHCVCLMQALSGSREEQGKEWEVNVDNVFQPGTEHEVRTPQNTRGFMLAPQGQEDIFGGFAYRRDTTFADMLEPNFEIYWNFDSNGASTGVGAFPACEETPYESRFRAQYVIFSTAMLVVWRKKIARYAKQAVGIVARKALSELVSAAIKKTKEFVVNHKKIIGIGCVIAALAAAFVAKKLLNTPISVNQVLGEELPQVEKQDEAKTPFVGDEELNVWVKDDYATVKLDLTPQSISFNAHPFSVFKDRIANNSVCIDVYSHDDERGYRAVGKALCVGGSYYLTNSHTIPTREIDYVDVVQHVGSDCVNPNVRSRLGVSDVYRHPDSDICIFRLLDIPPKKNIVKLFAKPSLRGTHKGVYVGRGLDGSVYVNPVVNIVRNTNHHIYVESGETMTEDHWIGKPGVVTAKGDCGAALVIETPLGPAIAGIHRFLTGGMVCALPVDIESIMAGALKMFGTPIVSSSAPCISQDNQLISLHRKSVFRFLESGSANVYGSLAGFKTSPKSKVGPTLLQPSLLIRGWEVKCGKPMMKGYQPWRIAAKDTVQQTANVDPDLLESVKKHFFEDVITALEEDGVDLSDLVTPLSVEAAVNGVPGVKYLDKINRQTSAGYPFNRSKTHYLHPMEDTEIWQEGVMPNDEIMELIKSTEEHYLNGVRACPVFVGHLKDQAIPFAKIKSGKTRIMNGGPMAYSIVVRKYLLQFVRLFQRNKYAFEGAPGLVCQSIEWEQMREYLTHFGEDNLIAGDYKLFDKNMQARLMLAAYWFIVEFFKKAGASEQIQRVIWCIAYDTTFAFVNFNGDLVEFFGSNPSGHPLTVIVNCIANSLYIRLAYVMIYEAVHGSKDREAVLSTFRHNVRPMTYGDDNVIASKVPWFNHTSMSQALAGIGVTYTMADKSAESVPFISIGEVSFLKRKWRYDEDVCHYVCPLEEDSIQNSLLTGVASDSEAPEFVAVSKINSALREYFYYGKQKFEEMRKFLREVCSESELDLWVTDSTFPTWDDLVSQFHTNSMRIVLQQRKVHA